MNCLYLEIFSQPFRINSGRIQMGERHYRLTTKPEKLSPVASHCTSTLSTRAPAGPRWLHAINDTTSARVPSATASTEPPPQFLTQPVRLRFCASRTIEAR